MDKSSKVGTLIQIVIISERLVSAHPHCRLLSHCSCPNRGPVKTLRHTMNEMSETAGKWTIEAAVKAPDIFYLARVERSFRQPIQVSILIS